MIFIDNEERTWQISSTDKQSKLSLIATTGKLDVSGKQIYQFTK